MLTGTATFHAEKGWRLLHPHMPSNQPVPANGTVTLTIERSTPGPDETIDVALDASGAFSVVTDGDIVSVTVVDRFENVGSVSL